MLTVPGQKLNACAVQSAYNFRTAYVSDIRLARVDVDGKSVYDVLAVFYFPHAGLFTGDGPGVAPVGARWL